MRLSVVIPTRDRQASLLRVLDALALQRRDVEGGVEILVVDDGSTDGTADVLGARVRAGEIVFLPGDGGGPARARNRAGKRASGEILVFLGDDTIPEPGFLAVHDAAHREPAAGPRAVLGYTTWDAERMRVTPLLVHLNEKGPQFGYALIQDPENVPFNFFYTSNVSLPRATFLLLGGFDETFPFPAWEDVELAYRASLAPAPLRIVYRPAARARHDHVTTLTGFRARQRRSGRAAAVFALKHPERAAWLGADEARGLGKRPSGLALLEGAVDLVDRLGVRLPGRLYDAVLRRDYLEGLKEGLSAAGPSGEGDGRMRSRKAEGLHC